MMKKLSKTTALIGLALGASLAVLIGLGQHWIHVLDGKPLAVSPISHDRDAAWAALARDKKAAEPARLGAVEGLGVMAVLAVLTTDAEATSEDLREILRGAVSTSFNVLMTDACRSTNDTSRSVGCNTSPADTAL